MHPWLYLNGKSICPGNVHLGPQRLAELCPPIGKKVTVIVAEHQAIREGETVTVTPLINPRWSDALDIRCNSNFEQYVPYSWENVVCTERARQNE